jgi:hypothetical protein
LNLPGVGQSSQHTSGVANGEVRLPIEKVPDYGSEQTDDLHSDNNWNFNTSDVLK